MRFAIPVLILIASAAQAQQYDIVIAGARVMNPASGLDAVAVNGLRRDQ